MATEILKSVNSLQTELEQAKNSLKGVDENIKRLIGRDPSDPPARLAVKRGLPNDDKGRNRKNRTNFQHENDEPPTNKRKLNSGVSVFKRLSDRVVPEPPPAVQKQIISKVIVTPKEVPSRQEALDAQSKDEKSKARNRRMFGALLGTLQKFQQEETRLKHKEDKRARLEKKIEEHEIKEKQEIKKERQELFLNRRKKQAEIKVLELKMLRMKEYAYWEEKQRPRGNFIMTKAKPHIHYLPRRMNDATREQLAASKADVEKLIEKRKTEVVEELALIEERMKRNFENKKGDKGVAPPVEQEEHPAEADTSSQMDQTATQEEGDAHELSVSTAPEEPSVLDETIEGKPEIGEEEEEEEEESRKNGGDEADTQRAADEEAKDHEEDAV